MIDADTIRNGELLAISLFTCATAYFNLRTKKIAESAKAITEEVKTIAEKTHTIVNSQKTAMMEELSSSRGLTLTLAQALLLQDPSNEHLKAAVIAAQTLYDKSVTDAIKKEAE